MSGKRPAKIGKYDVIDVVGRGGMGIVYKATDPFLDRLVAIKMMTGAYSDNPELLKRFFREAQSTGSLQHPNIVTVFELGDHDGNPYLVMEFLEGESLDSIISSRRELTHLEKINLIVDVCHGLEHAHHRGIVHRDIKPGNIMVSREGVVKIVDFGIAHMAAKSVTKTGQIMGSVSYMAPEQVNGKAVDARTDIFSTGVVLFELLTYTHPFDGESAAATLLKIIHDSPPPLKNFLSQYPPELDAIVGKALAKDREERYHSAEDFALDLGQLQGQLKQEIVVERLRQVTELLEQAELYKAKDRLLSALKIDRQNTEANLLLREVQQRIQKQQLKEQVLQLRDQAEEEFKQQQFDAALGHLERALVLDPTNLDLQQLRDSIQSSRRSVLELQERLKRAEVAHQAGDLDAAKQAVEEALQFDHDAVEASTLYQTIQYDWGELARQRQLENFLEQARREIAGRNFTSALEILQKAEAFDPGAPQLKALIESATLGREQERRRRELDELSHDIEEALNRDDYSTASRKADEGLKVFPEDRTLLKLKALAEKQRQLAERKQYVDEQLAQARTLLEQGRNEELLALLQSALAKAGPEPRLQSLLLIVRENVEHERVEKRKTEYLQRAKDALRQKAFQDAIRILETAHEELKDSSEITDLLQFANEQAAAEKRRLQVEAAAQKANAFIAGQEYEQAIQLLESALEEAPDEELRMLLNEARRAFAEYQKKLESTLTTAEKLLQNRKPGEAVRLLEAHSALLARSSAFQKLLETARTESERLRKVDEFIVKANQALEAEDYVAARHILQQCRELHGSTAELEERLEIITEKQSAAASAVVEKALSDAQILANANQFEPALEKLKAASESLPLVSISLKSAYDNLQTGIHDELARHRVGQFQDLIAAGEFTKAETLLQQTLVVFPDHPSLRGLEDVLREESSRRGEAQQAISVAQKLFAKGDWKRGGEILKKAFSVADRAPKVRQSVLQALLQGAESASAKDWRGSEILVQLLSELGPDFSQPSPALLDRISQRKREDILNECVQGARRLRSSGDLQGALAEIDRGLSCYQDASELLSARTQIEEEVRNEQERIQKERARREQDQFVHDLLAQAESELRLEFRIHLLEQGLSRYPEDSRIQRQLMQTRELWEHVKPVAEDARLLEEAKRYEEAERQWNILRSLYPQYPNLESNVSRLAKLAEQARAVAKAEWIRGVKAALGACDYDRAADLIKHSRGKFQQASELEEFETELQEGLKRRTKAQKIIADARTAISKKKWNKAAAYLQRASEVAGADPRVREQASAELLEASEVAIDTDTQQAERLLNLAAKIRPDAPLLSILRARVASQNREQAIQQYMTAAVSAQSGGDLQGALAQLEQGLSSFPDEPRLMQVKADVENRLRLLEKERQQRREAQKQRAKQEEAERQGQIELKRSQEIQQQQANTAEQQQKLARARELERKAEQTRSQQAEQKRQAELQARRTELHWERAETTERTLWRLRSPQVLKVAGGAAAVIVLAVIIWMLRPHTVAVNITSTPLGSTIRVKGSNAACVTPNCNLRLAPGNHELEISHQGYETSTEAVSVSGNGPNAFSIILTPNALSSTAKTSTQTNPVVNDGVTVPPPPSQRSSVEISGWMPGSKVFVDGTQQGTINKRGTFSTLLTPQEHELKVIEKNGESGSMQRPFAAGQRVLLPKSDFGLTHPATSAVTSTRPALNPEDRDWQEAKASSTIAALENFRARYPNNQHQAELQEDLDSLYWERTKAAPSSAAFEEYLGKFPNGKHRTEAQEAEAWNKADAANTLSALRDYQKRYPQGAHADAANNKIEDLRFQSARNSDDDTLLDAFLKDYPSGPYHDQIISRRDDLAWKKTSKSDMASLQAYVSKFPAGNHVSQARAEMQRLTEPSIPKTVIKPPTDDKAAILAVISQYNRAYNDRDLEALRKLWPGMDSKRISADRDFFNTASSVTSSYKLDEDPQINGDDALVKMTFTLGYEMNGKQEKPRPSKVTIRLKKRESAGSGIWEIQSVGK